MEVSHTIQSSQSGIPSPDGNHIALVHGGRLEIRSATTLHLLRSISIPPHNRSIRWSSICSRSKTSQRVLLADEDGVRVWDLVDERWTATIKNGSGGMGKIVNAEFGWTKDELLVFSDFGSKVTVWQLQTRRTVEIRDPKFASKGFAYRPKSGVLALLSRPAAQDILTLHEPSTYALIRTTILPTTDAQGLKWSPDGRWIAIWDTSSVGYKLHIYTAHGHLYRTYSGHEDCAFHGLGVRSLEWSPSSDYLAIGGHNRRVTILSTRTFSPVMFLDHTSTIQLMKGNTVWEEQVSASSQRTYSAVAQPIAPPTASPNPSDTLQRIGVTSILFNTDGTLLASIDATAPTTVWLWDLSRRTARAVFIQHSPVRHIAWHPTNAALLLIQCTHEESSIYIYDASPSTSLPYAIQLPLLKSNGNFSARWIRTGVDKKPAVLFGDSGNMIVAWPDGKDVIVRFEDEEGNSESEDSLFEVLTGRKSPAKRREMVDSTEMLVSDLGDEMTIEVEDTFVGRGRLLGA